MVVELRNGCKLLVMMDYKTRNYGIGAMFAIKGNGFMSVKSYANDLTCCLDDYSEYEKFDIIKFYKNKWDNYLFDFENFRENYNLIWERGENLNCKVVCVSGGEGFKKGVIYKIKDGCIFINDKKICTRGQFMRFKNIDEINNVMIAQFIDLVEE